MKMPGAFKVVLLFSILVYCANGYSFIDKTEPEIVHGQTVYFCEYKGLRLMPRSKFTDYDDCVSCTCSRRGMLSCVSSTSSYSYDEMSSKCTNVVVGCRNMWVFKSNNSRKCPRRMIPEFSAVGK